MKKMNCLIIGFGRMGERYFKALKKLGFHNIHIMDKSKNKLKIAREKYNLERKKTHDNFNSCIDLLKPNLAIVSTTADFHKTYVIQLAKKKIKNIIVEKPMATSVNDCIKMIRICKKNKVRLAVNHQSRFSNEIKILKKYIFNNRLGELVSMNVVAGNIGLAMNGIHYIEIFNFLTKNTINQVNASLEKKFVKSPRGKKFRDRSGHVIAKNNFGQTLYLNISSKQGHGKNVIYTFKNGNIFISELDGFLWSSIRNKKYFNLSTSLYAMPSNKKSIKFKSSDIVDTTKQSIQSLLKNKNYTNGNDALAAVKVLVAAVESARANSKTKKINNINNNKNFPWA